MCQGEIKINNRIICIESFLVLDEIRTLIENEQRGQRRTVSGKRRKLCNKDSERIFEKYA